VGKEKLTVVVVCVPGGFDRFFAGVRNSKRESPNCQSWSNWLVNMALSLYPFRRNETDSASEFGGPQPFWQKH